MSQSTIIQNYYELLECAHDASSDTIKVNYRRLALLYHPDKNHSSVEATAHFQKIQHAYETLSDAQKRRAYDIKCGLVSSGGIEWHHLTTYDSGMPIDINVILVDVLGGRRWETTAAMQSDYARRRQEEWNEYIRRDRQMKEEKEANMAQAQRMKEEAVVERARRLRQRMAALARVSFEEEARLPSGSKSKSKRKAKKCSNAGQPDSDLLDVATCTHDIVAKVYGKYTCSVCSTVQKRFAFACPGCGSLACAACCSKFRNKS